MRRYLALALATLALAGCGRPQVAEEPSQPQTAGEAPSDTSLYLLQASWTDHHGQLRQLGDLRGRPVLLAMVYTSCQAACPRIVADMQAIGAAVDQVRPGELGFVLVTMDPAVDTPERLAAFAAEAGFDQRWTLLNGSPEDVRALAALLGVKYRKVDGRDYAHSNMITVLDREGEVLRQQEGLGADPGETVKAIAGLLAPKAP